MIVFCEFNDIITYDEQILRIMGNVMSNLTKKALLIAFGELIEEKPFNKITITDLTKNVV